MKTHFILSIFMLAAMSCNSAGDANGSDKTVEKAVTQSAPEASADTAVTSEQKKNSMIFTCENDTIRQTLTVDSIGVHTLKFVITSFNKITKKEATLKGVAVSGSSQDYESEDDEKGYSYEVTEYIYEKQCWISLRIERDGKSKAVIKQADCEKLSGADNKFASVATMRRADAGALSR